MRPAWGVRLSSVVGGACVVASTLATPVSAQAPSPLPDQSTARRMSVSWTGVPIGDVLRAFAAYSGASIVASSNVTGLVTADINDQPWDVALGTILSVHGFVASEDEYGIIRVDNIADLNDRERTEPIVTRSFRISYSRAAELQAAIAPLLTERGSVSVVESTNTLVVSDIARVQRAIARLLP
ncbi:MAG: hypothetical protein OEO79_14665 [Gemmatimonadota bacterium]|nr:hypothetical protein [Gemmatimonadota bacterium]